MVHLLLGWHGVAVLMELISGALVEARATLRLTSSRPYVSMHRIARVQSALTGVEVGYRVRAGSCLRHHALLGRERYLMLLLSV